MAQARWTTEFLKETHVPIILILNQVKSKPCKGLQNLHQQFIHLQYSSDCHHQYHHYHHHSSNLTSVMGRKNGFPDKEGYRPFIQMDNIYPSDFIHPSMFISSIQPSIHPRTQSDLTTCITVQTFFLNVYQTNNYLPFIHDPIFDCLACSADYC